MKSHPIADIFPLMSGPEFEALKADIAEHGQREPIWTWRGTILDGRNRHRACRELGIKPRCREWHGNGSPVAFVVSLNLKRRHLNSSQKATVAVEMLPMLEAEARQRQRGGRGGKLLPETSPEARGEAREHAAAMLGTNARYVADAKVVKERDPELFAQVKAGLVRVDRARRSVDRERHRRKLAASVGKLPSEVRVGDFRKALADVPDGSVDLIFTDPPYAAKCYPLYGDLAALASRVLVPGGSLVAYAPMYALAELLPLMTPHLTYWNGIAVRLTGQLSRLMHYRVLVRAKFLLWFVKGKYDGEWVANLIDSQRPDKDAHEWAQSAVEAAYCIERMCPRGGLVLDPMCGSGTTLIAARDLGRRFLGVEIDKARAKVAAARLV